MIASNSSLRTQLMLSFICITIVAIALMSLASYIAGKKLLEHSEFSTINSIRSIKSGQIIQYLDMLQHQCLSASESTMTFDAIDQFREAFNTLQASPAELATYKTTLEKFYTDEFLPKLNQTATTPYTINDYFPIDDRTIIIQDWYLAENPQPLQKKVDLTRATAQHPYNTAHEKYHHVFKRYAKRLGISDMYLVDTTTGYVLYSLNKEVDFGTNLLTGPYKDTGLGQLFKELQRTNDEDFIKIIDFQFYVPAYGTPVGFITSPIYKEGKKLGGLIFKFPIDDINEIMTYAKQWKEVGLGKTGESFIIGADKLMRTIAREYLEDPTQYINMLRTHGYNENILDKIQVYDTTVLLKKVDLPFTQDALEGKSNTLITQDTLGRSVIYTYAPIKTSIVQWYIMVKINTAEAFEPINQLLWQIILLGIAIICITALAAFGALYIFTKPFERIITFLKNPTLTTTEPLSTDGSTEFATIANTYNTLNTHVHTLFTDIDAVHDKLLATNTTLGQHINTIQKTIKQLLPLANTTTREQEALMKNKKHITELDTQYGALIAQSMATLNLIQTTTTQVTTAVETASTELDALTEETGKGTSSPTLADIKSKIQHMLHKNNATIPMAMGLHNSCEQLKNSIASTQNQNAQKETLLEAIAKNSQTSMQQIEHMQDALTHTNSTLQELSTLQKEYEKLAQQLTAITKSNAA